MLGYAYYISTHIGGIIGGLSGWLGGSLFTKCPKCGKVFKY
jgi:hypothetical protein